MRKTLFLHLALGSLILGLFTSCGTKSDALPISSGTGNSQSSPAADALLLKARSYESAGKTKKAISAYQSINKKYPYADASAEALFSQGRLFDKQGDLFKAFESYQTLIARHPNSPRYAVAIQRQEAVAHSAADGLIKNNFLGMKTRVGPERTQKMLTNVRDNAPRAASAPKAQFAIGRVWQQAGNADKAIAAYQKIGADYSDSSYAPEALYQTGQILILKAERGNQNKANVNRARDIFNDLIQRYSKHKRATDARKRLSMLSGQDIQRSYDTAEFYRNKGNTQSAIFYYREVMAKSKSGSLYNLAKKRITELGG